MSVPPVTTIPFVKQTRASHAGGGVAVSIEIPDSKYYTRFTFQVTGFTAALTLVLEGSFNGTWSPLNVTSYTLPTITTSAAGMIFSIDLYAPLPGGLRFTSVAVNNAAGIIYAEMTGSTGNTNR